MFFAPHMENFSQFVGMRLGTLVIDDGGLYFLLALGINVLTVKYIVIFVIIAINCLISKLIIFCRR